jgi:hypothetical protein
MSDDAVLQSEAVSHCLAKIASIIARKDSDRRSIFQLGYNLGRLSELTGGGREMFWDPWKNLVEDWNPAEMEQLVQNLQKCYRKRTSDNSQDLGVNSSPAAPERGV